MNKVKGIIFDFDGVITDSEPFYLESVKTYLKGKGVESKINDLAFLLGQTIEDIACLLKSNYDLYDDVKTIMQESTKVYDETVKYDNYTPMVGLIDFLKKVKTKNIRMAIASSSGMDYLVTLCNQFEIKDYFDFIITGEDFERSKPDPEIYNVAAKKLGIDKKGLIIIEDSVAGITAGNAAGIYTIGLKSSKIVQDTSLAKKEVYSFDEIEL